MGKFVVESVQIVRHKYYVEVDDPEWACDGIVMNELEPFSSTHFSEDITNITPVSEFPKAEVNDDVNAAVMIFNYTSQEWEQDVRWDLK